MHDLIEIGETIRTARKALRMTQTELAKNAGVSRSLIESVENGRVAELGYKSMMRLLNAVGIDLRLTTFNENRPTLDDLAAENEEVRNAARMGR